MLRENSYRYLRGSSVMVPRCESRLKRCVISRYFPRNLQFKSAQMEITQHARYTCTFCGKVSNKAYVWSSTRSLIYFGCPSGFRETHSSRHLELPFVQKGYRRWCMDSLNNCGCHCSQVRFPAISVSFVFLIVFIYSTVRRLREITEA